MDNLCWKGSIEFVCVLNSIYNKIIIISIYDVYIILLEAFNKCSTLKFKFYFLENGFPYISMWQSGNCSLVVDRLCSYLCVLYLLTFELSSCVISINTISNCHDVTVVVMLSMFNLSIWLPVFSFVFPSAPYYLNMKWETGGIVNGGERIRKAWQGALSSSSPSSSSPSPSSS